MEKTIDFIMVTYNFVIEMANSTYVFLDSIWPSVKSYGIYFWVNFTELAEYIHAYIINNPV